MSDNDLINHHESLKINDGSTTFISIDQSGNEVQKFGQFIKKIRNETMRLSRERLGMLLGVSKGHVLKWENGSTNMSKSAKYLFFDQVQRHLDENGLGWEILPDQWPVMVPEDYKKNREWICQDEDEGNTSTSKYGKWIPQNFQFKGNTTNLNSLGDEITKSTILGTNIKKRTKRTINLEAAQDKMKAIFSKKNSILASRDNESFLKNLKSLLEDIQGAGKNVKFFNSVQLSSEIKKLNILYKERLEEKDELIKVKDELILMLRHQIKSSQKFTNQAKKEVILANKAAVQRTDNFKDDEIVASSDVLRKFEEYYAKEIDSTYKGRFPNFMPEDNIKNNNE